MREAAFVKQNLHKWQEFEKLLAQKKRTDPDRIASLFISITDDLAFAQTQYPESPTHQYLNQMAYKVHQAIYKKKREKKSRFWTFWKYELPLLYKTVHKEMLYAFIIFALAATIGGLSAANDDTFVRLILGDSYVDMTIANIEKGDPMAVYKSSDQVSMFLDITSNNIKVSFTAFAFGVFLSIGTGLVLFYNGVMLGAFQYFFFQKGLLLTSVLSIWIHGTLEIASIIIAGASGLVIGNSILFPGTYTRLESFKRGAKKGTKLVIGLVPLFIVAGFLESFVTRLTDWHWVVKLGIILTSATFIIYYFIIYPLSIKQHQHANLRKN
jgi:uncharacterized membrane protein SpoIIM required for sporulation